MKIPRFKLVKNPLKSNKGKTKRVRFQSIVNCMELIKWHHISTLLVRQKKSTKISGLGG